MKEINNIINDGIILSESMSRPATLPLLSLEIALRAYFSTYQQVSMNFFLSSENEEVRFFENEGNGHQISYYTSCFETIIHFQHFAELVCKAFLRNEHPLLAVDSSQSTNIFYKLLNKMPISSDEQDSLKSVEFGKSLERICTLAEITTNNENKVRYKLFLKWRKPLEHLNSLRNRLWHRGTFILKYPALDQFIGGYILPFVSEIVNLPEYSNSDFWKYKPLDCGIDPLTDIAKKLSNNSEYNMHEIAILKELGNAAYTNPLWIGTMFSADDPIVEQKNEYTRKNIESEAIVVLASRNAKRITKCPVCGINSLINTEAYVACVGCNLHIGAELGIWKLLDKYEFSKLWFR